MAISDDLPGVKVAVTVDGNDLKEYRDEELDEDVGTSTRYIEAASGQTFEVRITAGPDVWFASDTLACSISLDGSWVHSPLISADQCRDRSYCRTSQGPVSQDQKLRRYQFATLETVSEGGALPDGVKQFKDLGTIKVVVRHRKFIKQMDEAPAPKLTKLGAVSEKALKGQALSHCAQLSEPEHVGKGNFWQLEEVPGFPGDLATFVFKYRSVENLKIEGIIPRTPTPPPLEERDFETLTPDELRELHRRARVLRAEQESKIKVKRETNEDEPRRRKVARPVAGSTQLELDEQGRARASSTPTVTGEPEVIELD